MLLDARHREAPSRARRSGAGLQKSVGQPPCPQEVSEQPAGGTVWVQGGDPAPQAQEGGWKGTLGEPPV